MKSKTMRFLRNWVADSPLGPAVQPVYQALARGRGANYDRECKQVIQRVLNRESNAIDIGAHRGSVLRQILRVAPQGTHVAFEPLPEYAIRLRARFPGVVVHDLALADTKGLEPFVHVVKDPGLSGFKQHPTVTAEFEPTSITVPVDRLDDVLPADYVPALIKIDVEGAEFRVLQGGRETIRRTHPVIIFECGLGAAARDEGFSPGTMYDLVESVGLSLSTMQRWLTDEAPLDRQTFVGSLENRQDYYYLAFPPDRLDGN